MKARTFRHTLFLDLAIAIGFVALTIAVGRGAHALGAFVGTR